MIWRCNQPKEQLQDRAQQYERTWSCSNNSFFALIRAFPTAKTNEKHGFSCFLIGCIVFSGVFVTFSPWYRWLQVTRREFWPVRAFEKKRIGKEEKKNKEVTKVSHERLTRACFVGKYEYVLVLRTSYHVLLFVPSSIRTSPSRNGIFSRPMTSAVDVRSFWNGTYPW